jgi:hypothetical protein
VDKDESRWSARGQLFLNEIADWNFEEIDEKIKTLIISGV